MIELVSPEGVAKRGQVKCAVVVFVNEQAADPVGATAMLSFRSYLGEL